MSEILENTVSASTEETGNKFAKLKDVKKVVDQTSELKGDIAYYINKEIAIGTNKLDKDTMYTDEKWYYYKTGTDNKVVELQNVASYQSLTIPVEEGKTYCLWTDYTYFASIYSYVITDDDYNILEDGIGSKRTFNTSNPLTFTIPNGGTKLLLSATAFKNVLFTYGDTFHIQINEGDTPLPYEDYHKTEKITYREISEEVEDLKREVEDLNREVEKKVSILKLASRYNLVVGDTFELFYKGISNCVNSDMYDYEFSFADGNSYGKAWDRKWEYTPTSVGTLECTITVRDNTGNVVDEGNVDFVISETPQNPTSIKNVLCVGDSLTNTGVWCSELFRRLTKTGGTPNGYGLSNVKFIGTKQNSDGCKYEGYGGWTFDNYLSESKSNNFMNINGSFDKTDNDQHSIYEDSNGTRWKLESITSSMIKIINIYTSSVALPSSGTLTWVSGGENHSNIVYTSSEQASGNPFWDASTNSNNFTSYASKMGASSIDHCIILLGWNSSGSTESVYKASAKSFINGLLAEYPNCKITLLGLQVPSRNGFANNYGTSWKYYDKLQWVWTLDSWYKDIANEIANVEFVNLSGQFDTEYNCMEMDTTPNIRNNTQIKVQSNGVHPAIGGYYQIADAVLRNIVSKL